MSTRVDEPLDADAVAKLWRRVILESADAGDCGAVGRGAQCLLTNRAEAFHVYAYAPLDERAERLRQVLPPGTDTRAAAIERDRRRTEHIRHSFGERWTNPHLYHLMLRSSMGFERAANLILLAAGLDAREQK